MRSFESNENIHKKEGGSYYVVLANKALSVTLQSPGNESQRKHTAILRISNRQSILLGDITNDELKTYNLNLKYIKEIKFRYSKLIIRF